MKYEEYEQAVKELNALRENHKNNNKTEQARQMYRFYKFYDKNPGDYKLEKDRLVSEAKLDPVLQEELEFVLAEEEAANKVMHTFK